MQVTTARFGLIDVEDDKIITLPEGLVGFARYRRFVIVNVEKFKPFLWLQCLDDGNLCFIMTDPWQFFSDYAPELPDDAVESLEIDNPSMVAIYTLTSFSGDPSNIRINLLAPLCINHKTNKARQVILNDPRYSVSAPARASALKADPEKKKGRNLFHAEPIKAKMLIK